MIEESNFKENLRKTQQIKSRIMFDGEDPFENDFDEDSLMNCTPNRDGEGRKSHLD